MKTFVSFRSVLIILALIPAFLFTACVKEDFDVPPINIPEFTLPDGATLSTIQELKARHTVFGTLDSINDNVYIRGIVVGNDEFGNIYKTLVIQDETAGIEVKLNKTSLYNDYKLGQVIYIKCQGLFLGDYGQLTQLGSVYNGGIGQIADINIPLHLFKDSLPGPVPEPVLIPDVASLVTSRISTLVKFDGASFDEAGQTFVAPGEDNTNRTLVINGGTLIVRTSKYAAFAASLLPSGLGTVVGILGYYNGDYQLTIRNTTDLMNFVPDNKVTLLSESFDTDPGWAAYSVASNKNWYWSDTYTCMVANNYGGDVAGEDWLFTPEIDLTTMDSATLEFRTWSRYTDSGQPEPVQVLVSSDYTIGNDPNGTATWTQLTATLCPYDQSWTESGLIDLTAFIGSKIRIAWRYRASGTTSGTCSQWEVDAVEVIGKDL